MNMFLNKHLLYVNGEVTKKIIFWILYQTLIWTKIGHVWSLKLKSQSLL